MDLSLAIVLVGAVLAGFTTGFAGFGTGLVACGLWFYALPAGYVPPLVALVAIAGHVVGLLTLRRSIDWRPAWPYLVGGAVGVPLGVWALSMASPALLRTSIGAFLVAYALFRLWRSRPAPWVARRGRASDGLIGVGGGFLGGFSGLSGPLPLIWVQLRGLPADAQRAVYQPFNLVVLALASMAMAVGGQMNAEILRTALVCIPVAIASAWIGARAYIGLSPAVFEEIVLVLLLLSGTILLAQSGLP